MDIFFFAKFEIAKSFSSGWEAEGWFGEGEGGVKQMKKNQFVNIC